MAFEIVANLDDLEPGETLFVEGLREPICLVMLDEDDVRAVHNTCTHQQQPLHEGTVQDDDTLVCASHNSRFDLSTGESVGIPVVPALPVYACKIEGDAILVDIDQQLKDLVLVNVHGFLLWRWSGGETGAAGSWRRRGLSFRSPASALRPAPAIWLPAGVPRGGAGLADLLLAGELAGPVVPGAVPG